MEAEGDGLRRKALELTRARLEADGLLVARAQARAAALSARIAVVTSPDGAALHDIVAVRAARRERSAGRLVPAAVQGDRRRAELCDALDRVDAMGRG